MQSLKTHLKTYGESTSVKGVSKVIKSKYYGLKVIWLLTCLTGANLAIYQLVILFTSYLKYETITQISRCTDCSPEFPDVTLCNLHPLSLVSEFSNELLLFKDYLEYLDKVNKSQEDRLNQIKEDMELEEDELHDLLYTYYSLTGYFQNMNTSLLLQRAGNGNLDTSLVAFCEWYDWDDQTYTKEDCLTQSLYFFSTPDYSVCTTIHINDTNSNSNNTHVKGLEAILFLNDFDINFMVGYQHNIFKSQASGARVLIHPPNSLPEMWKGFNLSPGHEVSIHLEALEVERKPHPYSSCSEQEYLEENRSSEADNRKFIYNDQSAVSLCKQEEMIKKCGCYHPSLPMTSQMHTKHQVPGCITMLYDNIDASLRELNPADLHLEDSIHNVHCYYYTVNTDEHKELGNSCKFRQPCRQMKYSHRVYQSPWPHESYQPAFFCRHIDDKDESCKDYGEYKTSPGLAHLFKDYRDIIHVTEGEDGESAYTELENQTLIRRNFIQLKIYFLEREVELAKQVPAVTVVYLMGSVGGILNLWIGVTFFTLIELVDFVYTLITDLWNRRNKKKPEEVTKVYPISSSFNEK